VQASVEHVFPVRFGFGELFSLISELVLALCIVSTAAGESGAQTNGLVRISEAHFVHSGSVMMPQAHDGVLRNAEVIKVLNFEIVPSVLIDGGSVEEAAGYIAMVGLAQLEQVPLSLADLLIVSFAAREVALVLELLEAGDVGCAGKVEALISLDARDAPVMVVAVMTPVTSMTSVTPVTSVSSVSAVMMVVMMTVLAPVTPVTSMTSMTSVVVQGQIFVIFSRRGFRRRGRGRRLRRFRRS